MTDTTIDNQDHDQRRDQRRPRRWGTRQKALEYSTLGPTKFNELVQSGKIIAKKEGTKLIVDFDSIDDHIDSLPDASAQALPENATPRVIQGNQKEGGNSAPASVNRNPRRSKPLRF